MKIRMCFLCAECINSIYTGCKVKKESMLCDRPGSHCVECKEIITITGVQKCSDFKGYKI